MRSQKRVVNQTDLVNTVCLSPLMLYKTLRICGSKPISNMRSASSNTT